MSQAPVVKIDANDIIIGKPLPWPVYNSANQLLLQQGTSVASQRQVDILIEQGVFRPLTQQEIAVIQAEETAEAETKAIKEKRTNPFAAQAIWARMLDQVFQRILNPEDGSLEPALMDVSNSIVLVTRDKPDALLSAVHLTKSFDYATHHPIHTAALCTLMADHLKLDPEREQALIAAALTMNIGMLNLQRVLFNQETPLTPEQKAAIHSHPEKSVELLVKAGIRDDLILQIVTQHHEKIDGTGYPGHFRGDFICQEARILSIADIYAAMVTPREYREPIAGHDALKKIFMTRGKAVDESLAALLIREVGLYPPGSFVKLANHEVAVVARRPINAAQKAKTPIVFSVISPRGGMYEQPIKRDTNMEQYKILCAAQPKLDQPIDTQFIWGIKAG